MRRQQVSVGTANFLSGGLGSLAFWGAAAPADNIKNRIMGLPLEAPRASPVKLARHVYATEGLIGFYRGFVPCILRAFPANACALFAYEGILRALGAEEVGAVPK